jgi:hydrogenase large subunit
MSHITHLYHLSGPDFIDFTGSIVDMSPWQPSYTGTCVPALTGSNANGLIVNYVQALEMRRKCHTLGALFSGRQPIQNAIVPGGVTTPYSATYPATPQPGTDYDLYGPFNAADTVFAFTGLLNDVRNFIDNVYIPDVVSVATAYTSAWTIGVGVQRVLAYGDYPIGTTPTDGRLLIKRGIIDVGATGTTVQSFDQAYIVEQVPYSYYQYPALDAVTPAFANGRHPFDGITEPTQTNAPTSYTWLKAPRYQVGGTGTPLACEVGPLARMAISAYATDQPTVTNGYCTSFGLTPTGTYNCGTLVTNVITAAVPGGVVGLFSLLGRHAARALEAKFVADAMSDWVGQLVPNAPTYVYKRIPKQISTGYGLCEAPRGALGHWIKIEGRKVAKYQCVVPSTWNASPMDLNSNPGPIEAALNSSNVGSGTSQAARQTQIANIVRLLHPFDICIACAVHVLNTEGKEVMKFAINPDGRPAKLEISE